MIAMMRERFNKEEGFTLVELMVVVLIIAILIAIAIPTFLGARERAQDRAAQSNLRNALTAQKVYYTDSEAFGSAADLTAANIEPSLEFAAVALISDNGVIGTVQCPINVAGDDQGTILSSFSATGTLWSLMDVAQGLGAGTYYDAALLACPAVAVGGTDITTLEEDGFPAAP